MTPAMQCTAVATEPPMVQCNLLSSGPPHPRIMEHGACNVLTSWSNRPGMHGRHIMVHPALSCNAGTSWSTRSGKMALVSKVHTQIGTPNQMTTAHPDWYTQSNHHITPTLALFVTYSPIQRSNCTAWHTPQSNKYLSTPGSHIISSKNQPSAMCSALAWITHEEPQWYWHQYPLWCTMDVSLAFLYTPPTWAAFCCSTLTLQRMLSLWCKAMIHFSSFAI